MFHITCPYCQEETEINFEQFLSILDEYGEDEIYCENCGKTFYVESKGKEIICKE